MALGLNAGLHSKRSAAQCLKYGMAMVHGAVYNFVMRVKNYMYRGP